VLASLTTSAAQQTSEDRIRSTFAEISGAKRCFDEEDLARYAMNNGLPVRYVKPFIDAADKSEAWPRLLPSLGPGRPSCITYEKFSKYVRIREDALMQMFQVRSLAGPSLKLSTPCGNLSPACHPSARLIGCRY